MSTLFDRRQFLKGLGAASVAMPLMPSLSKAAEQGDFPQRFVVVFTPNGTVPWNWRPDGSEDDWSLSPILKPLAPFKDKVNVLQGIDNFIGSSNFGPGNAHPRGINSILTGQPLNEGNFSSGGGGLGWSKGISVDQYMAKELELGKETRFATLPLGANSDKVPPHSTMTFSGDDSPVFPDDNPYSVFDRVFGDFGDSGSREDRQKMKERRVKRRTILDAVKGDFDGFKKRLGAKDRRRVREHFESIRKIEKRLENDEDTDSCTPPESAPGGIDWDSGNHTDLPAVLDAQTELLTAALACDQTRVATYQWTAATDMMFYKWLDHPTNKSHKHHNLSHESDSNSSAQQRLTEINTWYSKKFADLLESLDSVPEGDGTMLDNTFVMWVSEVGKGNEHWLDDIPIVTAGSGGGVFKTGKYMKFDSRSHQDLLTAILQGFGVDTDSFGDNRTMGDPMHEILV